MRPAIAALAAALASFCVTSPAAADVRRAQLGDVVATLSLTARGGVDSGLRLSLRRAGTVVYSGPITTASGRPGALERRPRVRRFLDVRLRVLDLDGDGSGEAVIDLSEQGAYCCSHSVIVGARGDGSYHALEVAWGSFGSASATIPIKRGSLFVGRDARLEERYTPHVLSFEPVRVWSWSTGTLHDVSRAQPLFVQRDLSRLLATRRQLLRRKDHATIDLRGLLLAIAGDRLLLGRRAVAGQSLRADAAAGRVAATFPRAALRLLDRFGY